MENKETNSSPPFQSRLLIREDYETVLEMQQKCFPGLPPWSLEQFENQLKMFPEGQIGVTFGEKLIASSCSLLLEFDLHSDWHDWKQISDNGYLNNHNPKGDTLYCVEIMVDSEYRHQGISRLIYDARKQIAKKYNLQRIILGGRIPGYKTHTEEMSAREYIEKVLSKEIYDQVLTAQISNGFVLRGLVPDYFPTTEDNAGYATFLEWLNPEYIPDGKRRYHLVQLLRICTVQYQMRSIKNFDEFKKNVEYFVSVAGDYRSDFILFPELYTLQLLSFTPTKKPEEAARKLAEFTPKYLEFFKKMAVKFKVNIIGGSQFALENGQLYNIAYLFHRDGSRIDKQYKLHITPSERRWWGVTHGNKVDVFDTDRGKIAILICYDIEFPELARIISRKGAQIIFCPFNTDTRAGYLRIRYCAQARCIENHLYVVTSGCTGNLPFVENADIHYAQSGIYTPSDFSFSRDAIAAECSPNIETIVMSELDVESLRRHRYTGSVMNWNDRRKDMYKVLYREGEQNLEI